MGCFLWFNCGVDGSWWEQMDGVRHTKWTIDTEGGGREAVDVCAHPMMVIDILYIYTYVCIIAIAYSLSCIWYKHTALKIQSKIRSTLVSSWTHTHWNINEILEISDGPILTQCHHHHHYHHHHQQMLFISLSLSIEQPFFAHTTDALTRHAVQVKQ